MNPPHLYLASPFEVTELEFCEIFGIRKLSPWAIAQRCLRDPMFGCIGTILMCDRTTDGQPTTAYTMLA